MFYLRGSVSNDARHGLSIYITDQSAELANLRSHRLERREYDVVLITFFLFSIHLPTLTAAITFIIDHQNRRNRDRIEPHITEYATQHRSIVAVAGHDIPVDLVGVGDGDRRRG